MSTKNEKRLEKIQVLLDRLQQKSSKGVPIVVEGKNDVYALRRLGICGKLVLAKTSGKSFFDVQDEIEQTSKREIILLFDFDRRGKEWTNRLARCLEEMKITPNLVFWKMLFGLVGRDVKDIEGLATYVENFKKRVSCRKV